MRTTRSGWSGLTKAYQSVTSALWSSAVMGASRWLDANIFDGTSTSSPMARATNDFSCFMRNSSFGELVGRHHRNCTTAERRHAAAVTIGSVYELQYAAALISD